MSKRFFFVFTLLSIAALMLAACGSPQPVPEGDSGQEQVTEPTSEADTGSEPQPTEEPAEDATSEDATSEDATSEDATSEESEPDEATPDESSTGEATELIVGVGGDGYRLEGAGADLAVRPPAPANVVEPLVRITPDFEITPWLAESWEQVDDSTWLFHLRQGVMFHDGTELSAEAAKASIDRQNEWFPLFPPESVTAVDQYTLEIKTSRPFFYVAQALSHPSYSIHALESDPGANPIGTGPFQFDEYQQNEFIRVTKFDGYWGEPAQVDAVTLRFIPDPSARVLALQSGDVDMILPVPRDNVAQVEAMQDVELHVSKTTSYWALYFATKNQEPPYDLMTDVLLRQAVSHAIDREAIASQIFEGYAEAAVSLTPPVVNEEINNNVQGYPYDPERAKELFAEAGWTDTDGDGILDKDGQKLTLVLVSGFPPAEQAKPMPEIIQSQLTQVGVDAQLKEFNDVGAYYDFVMDSGEFHMVLESGSWNTPDVSFLTFTVFCGCNPEGEAILYERFWLTDEFDQSVMDSQGASDLAGATEAAIRTGQIMVDEFAGVAPILYVPQIGATRSHVQGFQIHPSNYSQMWNGVTIQR